LFIYKLTKGFLEYPFPVKDYINHGINEGILNLNNELRYSVYFTSHIKTILGKDPLCGKMGLYSCIQFLMSMNEFFIFFYHYITKYFILDMLVFSSFLFRNKLFGYMLIVMGPAGGGKSLLLNIFTEMFMFLSKEMNMDKHFSSEELNPAKADSHEIALFFAHESGKVNFTQLKKGITDLVAKTPVRQIYQISDQKNNHCTASYLIAHNEEGITYDTKTPFDIDDSLLRRLFPLFYSSVLSGTFSVAYKEVLSYYRTTRKLKILNPTDPEFNEQIMGCLFFALDIIQYFNIIDWDQNDIKPCMSNIRRAIKAQYLPLQVLTTNNLIFMDEIYPDNSNEMFQFKSTDSSGLALRDHLLSEKLTCTILSSKTIDTIAKNLKKFLDIDLRKVYGEWRIFGVKKYHECSEKEIKAYEQPHMDVFDHGKNFNPKDVQASLPRAQRFFISEKGKTKFNAVIESLFKDKKLEFDIKPSVSENLINIDSNTYLNNFKTFQHL
jgi:hypothetical protein